MGLVELNTIAYLYADTCILILMLCICQGSDASSESRVARKVGSSVDKDDAATSGQSDAGSTAHRSGECLRLLAYSNRLMLLRISVALFISKFSLLATWFKTNVGVLLMCWLLELGGGSDDALPTAARDQGPGSSQVAGRAWLSVRDLCVGLAYLI